MEKIVKKIVALALSSSITYGLSGCGTINQKEQSSSDEKYSSIEIKEDDKISENVLKMLFARYGFMEYIDKNTDFINGYNVYNENDDKCAYLKKLDYNQRKAIFDCSYDLYCYVNASSKNDVVESLKNMQKHIGNFYGDKNKIDVIREVLSKILPDGIKVDNKNLVKDGKIVKSLSDLKNEMGYEDYYDESEFNFKLLNQLMCDNTLTSDDISGELSIINDLICLSGSFSEDSLKLFKDNDGTYLLGNKEMFLTLLSCDYGYEIMYHNGILKNFNVICKDENYFVRIGNQDFYKLVDNDLIEYIDEILKNSNNNIVHYSDLDSTGLIDPIVYSLLMQNVLEEQERQELEKTIKL